MTNTRFQEIESTWNEFSRTPFPEEGKSFTSSNESDFTELDTYAAGCIAAFIHYSGRLDEQRRDCLKTCLDDLTITINELAAGPLKTYAERLHYLSKSVLEYIDQKVG